MAAFDRLAEHDRYGIDSQTVVCRTCGLIQTNPRMTAEDYRAFYASDTYRLLYDGEDYEDHYRRLFTSSYGQRMLAAVRRAGGPIEAVVEIGAGGGWNLVAFRLAGAHVVGWDYSEHLTALGRSQGIQMHRGSIREALAEGARYDVIILNHVLEHFLDPVTELRSLRGLLKPGGILYIGVPATDYPSLALLQNAHVYYFTDRTLAHYMARAGWLIEDVRHENEFRMDCIARPGDAVPLSLATEYRDCLARLRMNRRKLRIMEARERARIIVGRALGRLGLLQLARSLYRRLQGHG